MAARVDSHPGLGGRLRTIIDRRLLVPVTAGYASSDEQGPQRYEQGRNSLEVIGEVTVFRHLLTRGLVVKSSMPEIPYVLVKSGRAKVRRGASVTEANVKPRTTLKVPAIGIATVEGGNLSVYEGNAHAVIARVGEVTTQSGEQFQIPASVNVSKGNIDTVIAEGAEGVARVTVIAEGDIRDISARYADISSGGTIETARATGDDVTVTADGDILHPSRGSYRNVEFKPFYGPKIHSFTSRYPTNYWG